MPGTFTAVDLSRLPPPTVIEQVDYEGLLADAITQLFAIASSWHRKAIALPAPPGPISIMLSVAMPMS